MRKLVFMMVGFFFFGVISAKANDIYLAQNAAGSGNGASCSSAYAVSWFNNSGNWGSGTAKIGPGTTVHLCGTINAPSGADSFLRFQGSGTSGNPITLLWETGAIVQSPVFSAAHGGIDLNGKSWVVLNGGTNGIIQNTANGTNLSNRSASTLVGNFGNNTTIENLSMLNVYVHTNGDGNGDSSYGMYIRGASNTHIGPNNTMTQGDVCLLFIWDGGESNLVIDGNHFSGCNQDIEMGTANNGTTSFTNVTVSNNDATNWVNWDEPGNGYHHNFFHPFTNRAGSSLVGNLYIYGNNVHGDIGQHSTSFIFIENNNGGTGGSMGTWYIFNNLFHKTNHVGTGGSGLVAVLSDNGFLLNNTFLDDDTSSNSYVAFHPYGRGWTAENNIYKQNGYFVTADQSPITANSNVYYSPGQSQPWAYVRSYASSISAWRSACGCDAASVTTNPNLNSDMTLASGSPAIGFGMNLTNLGIAALDKDKAGKTRPSTGAWDAGAYQLGSGTTSNQPNPPSGLTVVVQ